MIPLLRALALFALATVLGCGGEAPAERHPEAQAAADELPAPGAVVVRHTEAGYTLLANRAPRGLLLAELQREAGFELVLAPDAWAAPELTLQAVDQTLADVLAAALEGVPFALYYVADEPGAHSLRVVVGAELGELPERR